MLSRDENIDTKNNMQEYTLFLQQIYECEFELQSMKYLNF